MKKLLFLLSLSALFISCEDDDSSKFLPIQISASRCGDPSFSGSVDLSLHSTEEDALLGVNPLFSGTFTVPTEYQFDKDISSGLYYVRMESDIYSNWSSLLVDFVNTEFNFVEESEPNRSDFISANLTDEEYNSVGTYNISTLAVNGVVVIDNGENVSGANTFDCILDDSIEISVGGEIKVINGSNICSDEVDQTFRAGSSVSCEEGTVSPIDWIESGRSFIVSRDQLVATYFEEDSNTTSTWTYVRAE